MKSLKRKSLVPLGVAVLLSLPVLATTTLLTKKKRNVILITVDTLRADHLGVYGYRRNTSPHLDQFAQQAIVFRHAFSHAPQTCPALGSLMTSYYPHETQVLGNSHILPAKIVTLAEILNARGYRTAAFVSNFSLSRGSGFEQGFEVYDDHMDDVWPPTRERPERFAPKTTQAAITWLTDHARQRFFLWVHYMDPHGPYTPPAPHNTLFVEEAITATTRLPVNETHSGKKGIPSFQQLGDHRDPAYYVSQYDGEIHFFDEAFGTLIEHISALGLLQNSVVIVTADHGEGMGEHDYYFAHREFLYRGLLHVPLILRLPERFRKAQERWDPVGHIDVLPTILDLLSIKAKASEKFRGSGLLMAPTHERALFSETHFSGAPQYALLFRGFKLIESNSSSALYDLRNDPLEAVNLLRPNLEEARAARVVELRARLDSLRQQDALHVGKPLSWALKEKARTQLRALGYLQ